MDDNEQKRKEKASKAYTKPLEVSEKKKEEIVIESIEDIIEQKPGNKHVREYLSGVLENIKEQNDAF